MRLRVKNFYFNKEICIDELVVRGGEGVGLYINGRVVFMEVVIVVIRGM